LGRGRPFILDTALLHFYSPLPQAPQPLASRRWGALGMGKRGKEKGEEGRPWGTTGEEVLQSLCVGT